MKKIKVLYALLSVAALFVIVLVVAALQAPPPGEKTAQADNCVPSLLTGQVLVNGLGTEVKIPLFPGAKRLTFTDATAVQYAAKAYDSEIKSFYDDRLTSLCWQIKEQSRDRIVYKNNGQELKLSLLPNPAGKTVIDYVVTTTEGVLGTVRIAQASCTSTEFWCNGGCVSMGTSCPTPTDASSCAGGTSWCPSSSGSGGWCQYGSCPSSTTTAWPTTQTACSSQGYFWCNNACQMTACSTSTSSSSSCTGTYQQPGVSYTQCNNSVCPNGCTWDSSGCPNGCYTSSSSGTTSSSCPSGQYWCNGACISNTTSCGSTNTNTWPTDKSSCTSQGKFWCTSQSSSGWCQTSSCPAGDYPYGTVTSCPAGQYMCNGACVASGTNCSQTTWPMDQASCTSQAKFWCTGSGGGGGWCQTTACSTNYSTTTCAAGQWQCNNACIPTTASCNGYNYNGTSTTAPSGTTCAGGYTWCASSQSCVNAVQPCVPATSQTTQPTQTQPTAQQQQQTQPQTSDQARTNQQPNNQQFNQNNQQFNQDNRQFNQGPSEADMKRQEEQEKRMREQQFQQMKRGMEQFSRGVTQMKRFVDQAKTRLAKQGVGLPLDLTNALAKAPELLAKLKAAKTQEEFEDLMGDMQDIGMIMQEWGPKMGELQRLGGMLSQLDKDMRNMSTNFKRIRTAAARRPELADAVKEVEAMLGVMGKKAADAKALAKSDPEGALELVEDFYANSEEYWNTAAVVDMVANITRGLTQANSEIRRAETRIRAIERGKQADVETIATLKDMLAAIKAVLPELKIVMARRPLDYEEVKLAAEDFWAQIQEFENLLAEQGQSFYAPTVKSGANIKLDIPEGFLGAPNNSGSQGSGSFEGGGSPGGF